MPDDNDNQNTSDPETSTKTPEEILAEVKAAMNFQRLYTYRTSRSTTWVINLTDKPLFVPYLGRRGVVLPVVTQSNKNTVAMECQFRPTKSIRKRLAYTLQLVEDIVNNKISIGTDTEVAADITTLLSSQN